MGLRVCVLILWAISPAVAAPPGARQDGPSFDCARATSRVNRMICANADLSGLDRSLDETFRAVAGQPTVDADRLRADEAQWLHRTLQTCGDARCVKAAFEARIEALRRVSLRASSPAASDETEPFPAPAGVLAASRTLIGRSCEGIDNLTALDASGPRPLGDVAAAAREAPVVFPGATVFVLSVKGRRLAVLFSRPQEAGGRCRITDAVVLPERGSNLMACAVDPAQTGGARSVGVGVRGAGGRLAYWEIAATDPRFHRQPLEVMGWTTSVRCRQPETGE